MCWRRLVRTAGHTVSCRLGLLTLFRPRILWNYPQGQAQVRWLCTTLPERTMSQLTMAQILCRKEISYLKMSQKEREQLQAELSILKELRHPNIVAYFERDHIKASQDLHLYMEYCGNGDLGRVIRELKNKNQVCEEEFVWSIFSQIVSALYRCHYGEDPPAAGRNVMGLVGNAKPVRDPRKPMILHRDLKPENSRYSERRKRFDP